MNVSGPQIREITENYFSYFSTKPYVVSTQKNRLNETKHMFKLKGNKIITILRQKSLLNWPYDVYCRK